MPENTVKIHGTPYLLRYPFNSLCRMQQEHGINVLDPATWTPSPRLITVVVWGGIVHAHPDFKLADVQGGLANEDVRAAHKTAMKLISDALPKADDEDAKPAATT